MKTRQQNNSEESARVPLLSFIVPAMNEDQTIETLYEGIKKQAENIADDWELLLIDDGSTDNSWQVMKNLATIDSDHVRAFRFRHNRGKADALALGYEEAKGDLVFTMDADLQDDPQEIPRFIEKLNEGFDIVSGYKQKRYDPWHKVLPSRVFNAVLSKLVDVKLHDHNCGFKLYKQRVVKALPMYGDMHRMVPSLASFEGFKTGEIVVQHHARKFGVSKYGWGRIAIGMMDMATVSFLKKYRDAPLHFAGRLGAVSAMSGAGLMALASVLAFFGFTAGWIATVGAICVMSGFFCVIQGLFLEHRVYQEMLTGRSLPVEERQGGRALQSFEVLEYKYTSKEEQGETVKAA